MSKLKALFYKKIKKKSFKKIIMLNLWLNPGLCDKKSKAKTKSFIAKSEVKAALLYCTQ